MNIYEPGLDVIVTLPFVDSSGNTVTPTALDYRIVDESGTEVVALTNIPVFTASDGQYDLTVDSANNTLVAGTIRSFRKAELQVTVGAETHWVRESYIIESVTPLEVLSNSFQTYDESLLYARDVAVVDGWDAANEQHRVAAMIQAFDYMHAFSYQMNYLDETYETKGIDELDATDWVNLVEKQKSDFRKTQLIQANYLLGGNPIEMDIADGLQSSTIGEVSQFYRPRASLSLPLCRDALKFVGRYIDWAPKITRV
jgi:hypothetical protein